MMQASIVGPRARFGVLGLHCAEEVSLLRGALEAEPGVSHIEIDQVRGRVSLGIAAPATRASVTRAVARVGLRLIPPDDGRAVIDAIAPDILWAGLASNATLVVALVASFVESGGSWAALVTDAGGAAPGWVSTAAYGVAAATAGVAILPKAWRSLTRRHLDMNALVVIAVGGAAWLGQISEAATVAALFAGAQLLEAWSAARARVAVGTLMEAPSGGVCCRVDGVDRTVRAESIEPGMLIIVRPGERIAVDAEVRAGVSSVDESAMTGESTPIVKRAGDRVFAGSVNGTGSLDIVARSRADDSAIARLLTEVAHGQQGRTSAERLVERFARVYTPLVVALALIVWLGPPLLLGAPWAVWFERALVVTLVACPCALVISTSVTIVAALSAAARHGILIKGGEHLEQCADLRAIAFDKTGVATAGRPRIIEFQAFGDRGEADVLAHVAAIESRSEHPLGKALVEFAQSRGVDVAARANVSGVQAVLGEGIEGIAFGRPFWIGNGRFLRDHHATAPEVVTAIERLRQAGLTVMACGEGDDVWAVMGARDEADPNTIAAVRELRALGISRIGLISGDDRQAVAAVAAAMQADDFMGECLPADKARLVTHLTAQGHTAMVGDGINDVPALAAATVAIAVGPRATDAALKAAHVVLVQGDLRHVPWLVGHARSARRVVKQNLGFAIGLKLVFLGAAVLGDATLWMAVLADTGATVLVTLNGLRLLRGAPTGVRHTHAPHHHAERPATART